MKKTIVVLFWLFVLTGLIWILQGENYLPGSFMTGNPTWTRNGIITAIIGLIGIWWSKSKE